MEVDYSYENETRVNLGFQFYFLLNKIGIHNVNILLLQDPTKGIIVNCQLLIVILSSTRRSGYGFL